MHVLRTLATTSHRVVLVLLPDDMTLAFSGFGLRLMVDHCLPSAGPEFQKKSRRPRDDLFPFSSDRLHMITSKDSLQFQRDATDLVHSEMELPSFGTGLGGHSTRDESESDTAPVYLRDATVPRRHLPSPPRTAPSPLPENAMPRTEAALQSPNLVRLIRGAHVYIKSDQMGPEEDALWEAMISSCEEKHKPGDDGVLPLHASWLAR